MRTPGFQSIYRRAPSQHRGFTSTTQRDYLGQTNPELAANMARYTDPTSYLPRRAARKKGR